MRSLAAAFTTALALCAYHVWPGDDEDANSRQSLPRFQLRSPENGLEYRDARPTVRSGQPAPSAISQDEANRLAQGIQLRLKDGATSSNCSVAHDALIDLAANLSDEDPLRTWALDRIRDCVRTFVGLEDRMDFLEELIRRAQNYAAFELAGENELEYGRFDGAITNLTKAVQLNSTSRAWDQLANAKLALAKSLKGSSANVDDSSQLLSGTIEACSRSIELQGKTPSPWTLETLAEAQLALGDVGSAVQTADSAIAAFDYPAALEGDIDSEAFLYMKVGEVYYKSGQKAVGLGYLDAALNVAQSEYMRSIVQGAKRAMVNTVP